jgi:hypothetical protein
MFMVLFYLRRDWTGQKSLNEYEPSVATVPPLYATSEDSAFERGPASPYRPRIFFTDVESGPVRGGPADAGVPISIFGKGFGSSRGTSRVTIGGVEVSRYVSWGENNAHNRMLDMIVVQPGPKIKGGPVVVTVGASSSNADLSFTATQRNIYHVATGGSDSASCSEAAPCATVLHTVMAVMQPGDTVLVRGGIYDEGEVWIRADRSGTAQQPKVIKNYPGEEAYFRNAARGFLVDANYITVSGFNFQNGKAVAAVGWASKDQTGDRFINNTFTGKIEWAAIDTHGKDHVLAGNVCEVSGSSVGTMGHCFYVSQGSNLKILYNVGSGPPGYPLHLYDERRSDPDIQRLISNVIVEGNVFKSSTQRSGMMVAMGDAGRYGNAISNVLIRNNIFAGNNHLGLIIQGVSRDIKVYNNTFYENGRQALHITSDPNIQRVDIRNNLFVQTGNNVCKEGCSWFPQAHVDIGRAAAQITLEGNAYGPGPASVIERVDPRAVTGPVYFADAPRFDFHPNQGSAGIRKSAPLPEVLVDWDGRERPPARTSDMGAFEHLPAQDGNFRPGGVKAASRL